MYKQLFIVLLVTLALVACGGNAEKKDNEKKIEPKAEKKAEPVKKTEKKVEKETEKTPGPEAAPKAQEIAVEDYLANPESFVGKELTMTGTVVHICKHGGKKLFIIGKDPQKRVKFTAGKEMAAFDIKLEGSPIKITGIVEETRINEAKLDEMEKNVKAEKGHDEKEHKEVKNPDAKPEGDDHHHASKDDQLKHIAKMREQIKKSEKGYLSSLTLACVRFEVLEAK